MHHDLRDVNEPVWTVFKAITHVREKLQTVWVFTANKTRVEDALVVLTYRIA